MRKSGERLRVTGQLVEAASGNHIWAERYDRPASDIFAFQDEITLSAIAAIEPQLYASDNRRLLSRPSESLDAWGSVATQSRCPPSLSTLHRLEGRAASLDRLDPRRFGSGGGMSACWAGKSHSASEGPLHRPDPIRRFRGSSQLHRLSLRPGSISGACGR